MILWVYSALFDLTHGTYSTSMPFLSANHVQNSVLNVGEVLTSLHYTH